MLKALIVDDDIMIRRGIKNSIPWNSLGISDVEMAEDGDEGLEIFEKLMPDIVLTDIKMPQMNGLELLKRMKSLKSNVKVIILSGFDDFKYAQVAIEHGAFAYLLKSANIKELMSNIEKAVSEVKAEQEKSKFLSRMKGQLNLSLPLLRYRYLNALVNGCDNLDSMMKKLEFADVRLGPGPYTVIVAEIDGFLKDESMDEEDRILLKFSVINISEELVGNRGICFEGRNEEIVIIYYIESSEHPGDRTDEISSLCENIGEKVSDYLNMTLSFGIGNPYDNIAEISKSYNDAKKALEYKLFLGNGSIIPFSETENDSLSVFPIDIDKENMILSSLRIGDKKQLFQVVNNIFDYMGSCRGLGVSDFHRICVEMLSLISRVLIEFRIDFSEIFGSDSPYYEEIKKYKTFDEIRQWVLDLFSRAVNCILNTRILQARKIIEKARQYIDRHYMEEITLNKIAELVYISPGYFSRLFSSEVGQSFLEYLTSKRIEKAKQLLGEKDSRACDVGKRVGYDNPYYFSRIFKKYTGMTPIEYKESLNK